MTKTIYHPMYEQLISLLRDRRRELGMSQEDVARKLSVCRSWVGKVEQRERRLDVMETWCLCRVYGVSLADVGKLLDGKGGNGGSESS